MTTTSLRFRAALVATVLPSLLLAGCAAAVPAGDDPVPVEPDGGTGTTDPLALDYPFLVEPETAVPRWRGLGEALSAQLEEWDAACTPADVAADPECAVRLDEFIRSINGIHQEWWALDDGNWESGEYSGLVALTPTRDATLAARESHAAWNCATDEMCVGTAYDFHADLTALDEAFTAWRGWAG